MATKKQKTAAIYDRWLYTLGGGEQVAFAYAEVLRDLGYKTSLLTHKEVDIHKAEKKMDVDLKGISIEYLPLQPSIELSQYTEQYDIFINTSYLDYFPNRSKKGILSVFFPGKIFLSPFDYLKRAFVVPSFRKLFIYPTDYSGFRFDQFKKGTIYKWLGEVSSITFNQNVRSIRLTLYCRYLSFSLLDRIHFSLNGEEVVPQKKTLNHHTNCVTYDLKLVDSAKKKLTIQLPKGEYSHDVALVRTTIPDVRYFLYNAFKRVFPRWEMRLHGGPEVTKRSDLETYHKIITISEFVKKWTFRYWQLQSQVLYPPVHTKKFKPAKQKKNWIIHVGRFFVTGHNKKQLELAKLFTRLMNTTNSEGWELHFVGSVHDGERHHKYFESVKQQAAGYPVYFHTDVSASELRELVGQAKIYWHATGLDENEDKTPILFEHFGITTVEAMSAGCVPVVLAAGGQSEIVTEESGFTWKKREELLEKTSQLIQNPSLLRKLSRGALKRSEYFDRSEFVKRFKEIIES